VIGQSLPRPGAPRPLGAQPGSRQRPGHGNPIPLFNLVYHDALLLPWSLDVANGAFPRRTGVSSTHWPTAACPTWDLIPARRTWRVRTLCALHRRVALLEMARHEFLDASWRGSERHLPTAPAYHRPGKEPIRDHAGHCALTMASANMLVRLPGSARFRPSNTMKIIIAADPFALNLKRPLWPT